VTASRVPDEALEARYRARSLWLDGVPEPLTPRPNLTGQARCDVAIVGAGFTGLWAAYYLKRLAPGLDVAVVEREIAGYGPSGRNGGWVSSGIPGNANVYRRLGGSEPVRRALRETQATVDEIGRIAAAEGIDCGFVKAGTVTVATTEPQRARLLPVHASNHDGADDQYQLSSDELQQLVRIPGVLAAVFSPHAARVNPARLVRGLAAACERLGVTIYERTNAVELAPQVVRCGGGELRADTVLQATESYSTQLPNQRMKYLPLYSLMIATEPLPATTWHEIGWPDGLLVADFHHLFFYAQRTADGRIAIGGRGAPYTLREPISERNERSESVARRLRETLRRHFPPAADARVTHQWGGPLAVPRDWSMSVTFDRRDRMGWAGGYSGHGVAAANIAGRTLADLVLDRQSDLVTLPWVQHLCRQWEPEPLRYLTSRAIVRTLGNADASEDRSGRTARRVLLLKPFLPDRE
jgi:glycine/D-amino acid oxidase-like deaminating enzyme